MEQHCPWIQKDLMLRWVYIMRAWGILEELKNHSGYGFDDDIGKIIAPEEDMQEINQIHFILI